MQLQEKRGEGKRRKDERKRGKRKRKGRGESEKKGEEGRRGEKRREEENKRVDICQKEEWNSIDVFSPSWTDRSRRPSTKRPHTALALVLFLPLLPLPPPF